MSASKINFGAVDIVLGEEYLAQIGRATTYEAIAKTCLSTSLKAIDSLSLENWKARDKLIFGQLVDCLEKVVCHHERLHSFFDPVRRNHKRWREKRNFVVHAIWGQNSNGIASAYCIRTGLSGDENDVVTAVNDCFWLLKKCREFQYEVGKMVCEGIFDPRPLDEPGISILTEHGLARF